LLFTHFFHSLFRVFPKEADKLIDYLRKKEFLNIFFLIFDFSDGFERVDIGVEVVDGVGLLTEPDLEDRAEGQSNFLDEVEKSLSKPASHAAVDQKVDGRVQHDQKVIRIA
jgi:hypothetical protein